MSVGSLSPTALIFRAPHRSGDPVVDARSFLCRNGHGLRPPSGRCRCERAFPSNSPSPACFSCLCPETGHRLFLLRPSSHRRAVSEVLFAAALFRYGRLPRPAARSACMPAPSCGPSGHNHCIPLRPRLPCPVSRGPSGDKAHHRPVAPKTEPVTSNQINVSGRDGAGRMLVRRTAAIRNGDTPKKGTRGSASSFPRLPSRKETP